MDIQQDTSSHMLPLHHTVLVGDSMLAYRPAHLFNDCGGQPKGQRGAAVAGSRHDAHRGRLLVHRHAAGDDGVDGWKGDSLPQPHRNPAGGRSIAEGRRAGGVPGSGMLGSWKGQPPQRSCTTPGMLSSTAVQSVLVLYLMPISAGMPSKAAGGVRQVQRDQAATPTASTPLPP